MRTLLALMIAFSQGIGVSAAVVVFISVLGITPLLSSITGTRKYIRGYAYTLGAGVVIFGVLELLGAHVPRNNYGVFILAAVMWFCGTFTGVLLSALAEVFDIFPAFTVKLGLQKTVKVLILVLAAGKMTGAFFFWLSEFFR